MAASIQPPGGFLMKRRILFGIGLLLSVFFLWLSFRGTEFGEIFRALRSDTNFWYAIPFVAGLLSFCWLKALRWSCLLSASGPNQLKEYYAAVLIGYTGNLVLPAQMGELVRIYVLSKRLSTPVVPVFTSIALERIFDLMVMLIFLIVAMFLSEDTLQWMNTLGVALFAMVLCGMSVCYVYVTHTPFVLRIVAKIIGFFPPNWQTRVLGAVEQGALGIGALRNPALLFWVLVTSCLMWAAMVVCTYLSMSAVGIDLPVTAAIFTFAVIIGGMMLPASPGFIGTIQFCFVLVLGGYGISKDQAIAASFYYHVLITIPILIVGYGLALKMGFTTSEVRREASELGTGEAR